MAIKMTTVANYQTTTDYSEQTLAFLSEHIIAPSPINYAVIYLYITKQKPKLNILVEHKLKSDDLISAEFIDELYRRFVSYSHQIENSLLTPF